MACIKNELTTVSILLKAGANPNTCNKVKNLLSNVTKDSMDIII